MDERFFSTLGLAMRAGKLLYGFDTVKGAVNDGKVFLLLTASDLSEKSVKEVRFLALRHGIPCLPLSRTQAELARSIGKLTGTLAVTDQGLSRSLLKAAGSPLMPGASSDC